jgi:hypothetical protein
MTRTRRHPEEKNKYSFTGSTIHSYKQRVYHMNRGVKQRNRYRVKKIVDFVPEPLFKRDETDMMC